MSPRIGSLFAGYGGLDQAVESVYGGSLAWYSEIDKGALKILAHRYPDVPNVGDVTAVDWSQVDLSSLGYDASWHSLRAADVGAPHGRFRVFVVAHLASDTRGLGGREAA